MAWKDILAIKMERLSVTESSELMAQKLTPQQIFLKGPMPTILLRGIPTALSALASPEASGFPHIISDVIAEVGLLLVFHEFNQIENLRPLISLGTTLDGLADEGPEGGISYLGITNAEHYRNLRKWFIEQFGENTTLLKHIAGFIWQIWSIEKQTHRNKENLDGSQKREYRELVDAIWARTYTSLGMGILFNQHDSAGIYLGTPSCEGILPTSEELQNMNLLNYDEVLELHQNFIQGVDLDKLPGKERTFLLYLLVIQASVVYDNWLNRVCNEQRGNPTIPEYTRKYLAELARRGLPSLLTEPLFYALFLLIKGAKLKKSIRSSLKRATLLRNIGS